MPKLHDFFRPSLIHPECEPHAGWFSFEGVPLKWHYPLGLLYDLYAAAEPISQSSASDYNNLTQSVILAGIKHTEASGEDGSDSSNPNRLPWRLTLHFENWPDDDLVRLDAGGLVMHDAFINSVKEADSLRIREAKGIMTLSKEDTAGFWAAIQNRTFYSPSFLFTHRYSSDLMFESCSDDLTSFRRINNLLLPSPPQPFRQIPLRIFLPLPPDTDRPALKVVQSPVSPTVQSSAGTGSSAGRMQAQTVGSALHSLLPNLFPSRRIPVLAKPVLHGVVLPMSAPLEEVARSAAYGDGWVSIVISMVG